MNCLRGWNVNGVSSSLGYMALPDLQAYLGSDSEGEEQAGQEAVNMEEYRKRLLSGADDMAQRKGGKDWAPAPHNTQVSCLFSTAPSSRQC